MTDVPDLTHNGQGQVTVRLNENNEVVMPDVNNPPTWLTLKDLYRETFEIGHYNGDREAGFDLSSFDSKEHFVEVLEDIGFDAYYDYVRVDTTQAESDEKPYYRYVWGNDDGMIVFGNNPITGMFRDGTWKEYGYASYIGIEGTQEFVERAYQVISQEANTKDYDMSRRSFI